MVLSNEKIAELSERHSLFPYQEEQRYRISYLLYLLKDFNMVFKGGTMIWLAHGNLRYSRDLDFNLDEKSETPSEEKLRKILRKAFGTDELLKSYRESKSFINAEISFPGITIPLGIKVKLEISIPYQYIDAPELHYFSFSEYGLTTFPYRILSTASIIADKINGLQKRKKMLNVLKDAFDLWFLVKVKKFSTSTRHIENIFQRTGIKFSIKKIEKRLKECAKKEKEFKQYLLPTFKGDMHNVLEEVKYYVRELYEKGRS